MRARWKRRTLRPASAMWSSARTPGDFGTRMRGASGAASGSSTGSVAPSGSAGAAAVSCEATVSSAAAACAALRRLRRWAPDRVDRCASSPSAPSASSAAPSRGSRRTASSARSNLELSTATSSSISASMSASGSSSASLPSRSSSLELDEPLRDGRGHEHLDVVDGHLDDRPVARVGRFWRTCRSSTRSCSARSPAIWITASRASDSGQSAGGRPGSAGPSCSSRRWRAAAVVVALEALERDDRAAARRPQAARVAGRFEGAIGVST